MNVHYGIGCLAVCIAVWEKGTHGYKLRTSGICLVAIILAVGILAPNSQAAEFCGSLERRQGPWDYTDPRDQSQLALVEDFHFGSQVFMLQGSATALANNLSYTLGRFPNHHRALDAMSRLALREGREQPANAEYSVNCYFDRAMRWRPSDATVRLVYAIHLYRTGDINKAIAEARRGLELAPNDTELHYNLGLFLVRKGDYAAALPHARQAYDQGYALPGLRRELERAGLWAD